jgi:hypothetical protein
VKPLLLYIIWFPIMPLRLRIPCPHPHAPDLSLVRLHPYPFLSLDPIAPPPPVLPTSPDIPSSPTAGQGLGDHEAPHGQGTRKHTSLTAGEVAALATVATPARMSSGGHRKACKDEGTRRSSRPTGTTKTERRPQPAGWARPRGSRCGAGSVRPSMCNRRRSHPLARFWNVPFSL